MTLEEAVTYGQKLAQGQEKVAVVEEPVSKKKKK